MKCQNSFAGENKKNMLSTENFTKSALSIKTVGLVANSVDSWMEVIRYKNSEILIF